MSIITRFLYKIKLYLEEHLEEVGVCLIIVLVGVSSFLLGKYSVNEKGGDSGITFERSALTASSKDALEATKTTSKAALVTPLDSSQVVASKSGTKYYLPWCGAAARIKDENKVYFASPAEAEKAGYSKASNCKGL